MHLVNNCNDHKKFNYQYYIINLTDAPVLK